MVEWLIASAPVDYPEAVRWMEARAAAIRAGDEPEAIWLVEHPPIYTAGTSASPEELIQPSRFPVHRTGRGGRFTYHGPGQRVVYVLLDLKPRGADLRAFVGALEGWVIDVLGDFGVNGAVRPGRVGVWVDRGGGVEEKIAAIGIRVRHWVSFHGLSLNVDPDLSHFAGIVPCGISEHGVTSLAALGVGATMNDVDIALKRRFAERFQ